MKQNFIFTISIVLVCNSLFAQFEDNYGKLTSNDISIKECAFDPSASLVITLDEGSTEYNTLNNQVTIAYTLLN